MDSREVQKVTSRSFFGWRFLSFYTGEVHVFNSKPKGLLV